MKQRRIWMAITALAALLAMGACNGNGGDEDTGNGGGDVAEDTGGQDVADDTGGGDVGGDTGGQDTGVEDTGGTSEDTGESDGGATDTSGDATPDPDTAGGDASDDGGQAGGYEVVNCDDASPVETVELVGSNEFQPAEVTISTGDVVKWDWKSNGHTVTSGDNCTSDGNFDSGLQSSGSSYCVRFNETGTVDYYCQPHCGLGMTGKVVVE